MVNGNSKFEISDGQNLYTCRLVRNKLAKCLRNINDGDLRKRRGATVVLSVMRSGESREMIICSKIFDRKSVQLMLNQKTSYSYLVMPVILKYWQVY